MNMPAFSMACPCVVQVSSSWRIAQSHKFLLSVPVHSIVLCQSDMRRSERLPARCMRSVVMQRSTLSDQDSSSPRIKGGLVILVSVLQISH